jgi:FAD dependent oxidoreductase
MGMGMGQAAGVAAALAAKSSLTTRDVKIGELQTILRGQNAILERLERLAPAENERSSVAG